MADDRQIHLVLRLVRGDLRGGWSSEVECDEILARRINIALTKLEQEARPGLRQRIDRVEGRELALILLQRLAGRQTICRPEEIPVGEPGRAAW